MKIRRQYVFVVTCAAYSNNPPETLTNGVGGISSMHRDFQSASHRATVADYGPWAVWKLDMWTRGWNPELVLLTGPGNWRVK